MDIPSIAQLQPSALAGYGGGWPASLRARVARIAGRSALSRLSHDGPLRIQKGLWPEGPNPLHLILLHPPGGIAAGDTLAIDLAVESCAHALVTTPGAGRWYRADEAASQHVALSVDARGSLEWLPQETIVHDGALAHASIEVDVSPHACAIGWEIIVLGRRESGERFARGELRQGTRIRSDGRLLFDDHALIRGGHSDHAGPLAGRHVCGLLWAVAPAAIDEDLAERVEAAMLACEPDFAGASRADARLLLARVVDATPQRARTALTAAWRVLRPALLRREARLPRIWAT